MLSGSWLATWGKWFENSGFFFHKLSSKAQGIMSYGSRNSNDESFHQFLL